MGEADPFAVALAGALVGGCVGGLISFLIQRWRYNIDRWTILTDELRKEIVNVSDLSSEFWLKTRNNSNNREMMLMELRIKGCMARIDALKIPFEDWCARGPLIRFKNAHGEFVDAVTGGQFTAVRRDANAEAALKVQIAAADLIGAMRDALDESFGVRAWIDRKTRKD